MATVEVTSIPFTDKEYVKALETLLNQSIDSLAEKLDEKLLSEGYINLQNNLVINFTGTRSKRRFFLYESNAEEQNPQNGIKFDKHVAKFLETPFVGKWPSEDQIKKISETYHSECFIFTENDIGNSTVLVKNEDNAWVNDEWKMPAYPVPIYNIEGFTNSKSLLAFLLSNKLIPVFDEATLDDTFSKISKIFTKSFEIDGGRIVLSEESINDLKLNDEWEELINQQLLKGMGIENTTGFTADDVKLALKESDFRRAEIDKYPESYFKAVDEWLWDLYPKQSRHGVEIPKGDIKIRARDPNDDIKKSIIAIDFGTSSTVVVEYDQHHPNEPRQICVGKAKEGKYENPTLMQINKYGNFLASYYSKKARPNTKWSDLMVSHSVKDNILNAQEENLKAILSHLKQWAAENESNLCVKPANEEDPIQLRSLSELLKHEDESSLNPIEIYAYFLGLYINNRHEGYGIHLNYQLSYPATYNKDVVDYIVKSFWKGIRKSIPEEIADDRIIVEKKVSEPEAYAVMAMKKFGFEPEKDEKVKYAIFDFGGGTSDFAYGYWSRSDKKGKQFKIETIDISGEQFLGGENILDGLAFEVFSEPKNLEVMKNNNCKFYYGIEKKQVKKGVPRQYLASNYYAKNNMTTLIELKGEKDDEGNENKGLREYWENQEKYFQDYFSNSEKSNDMMILINEILVLLQLITDEKAKKELEDHLEHAQKYNNELERKMLSQQIEVFKNQHKDILTNKTENTDEVTSQLVLWSETEDAVTQVPKVTITLSKKMMYKYFSDSIKEGIDTFFSALKTAFAKKNDYNGSINIFLAGNASKSPILRNLMEERIRKESNENVTFELFNRFDSPDYEEKLRHVLKDIQGWEDEDVENMIESEREKSSEFQPTGKTGVAFGIVEMLKDKIEIATDTELEYFKYYLGDVETIRGKDRFIPFQTLGEEGKPSYPSQEWIQIFDVEDSTEPVSKTLYYTSKADCMDGMQSISIANAIPLDFPCITKGQQIYIKAIGNDKIVYMAAQSPEEAEELLNKITSVEEKEKHTAYLK